VHLFHGRYNSLVIDKDNYLLKLRFYIHLNPVQSGIVKKPKDYEQSSYKSYIKEVANNINDQDLIFLMISKDKIEAERQPCYVKG